MKNKFPIISILVLSPIALATGCNGSSSNASADNKPSSNKSLLNDGEFAFVDASCDQNTPPYGSYGSYGSYTNPSYSGSYYAPYSASFPFGKNTKYILSIINSSATFKQEVTDPTSGIVCKYSEGVILDINNQYVTLNGNGTVVADPSNHTSCAVITKSLIESLTLDDEYEVQTQNNFLILTAKSDKFCSTYGFLGENAVVTFEKK
nr:hypothetical protein GTC16762_14120 [Pigmentibacter ruber]